MAQNTLTDTLYALALPAVRAQGLDIWGIELVDGRHLTVRLFVEMPPDGTAPSDAGQAAPDHRPEAEATDDDTDNGPAELVRLSASVDQCEAVSRQFSLALDAEDAIDRAYTLEVSTPGFNRRFFNLGQMQAYVGDLVEAHMEEMWAPADNLPKRRVWKGVLLGVCGNSFTIAPAGVDSEGEIVPENLGEISIPFAKARRVCRVHVFRAPAKPGKSGGQSRTRQKNRRKGRKA